MTNSSDVEGVSRNLSTRFERQNVTSHDRIPRRVMRVSAYSVTVVILSLALLRMTLPGHTYAFAAQGSLSATTTSLVSSLNPSYSSQSLTFTATVTSQAAGTPTGTVTFLDGSTQIAQVALNANGQAQCVSSALSVGSHSITGQYSGDANFSPSTVALTQVINAPPTPVSIAVTPANPVLIMGNTQQLTATGKYGDGSTLDLTKTATWTSSDTTVATVDPSGLASAVNTGSTNTTASYNGVTSPADTLGVKNAGANIAFLGGGSSAMFLELGQAAQSSTVTATPCVWTHASNTIPSGDMLARDDRPSAFPSSVPIDEYGDIWITWGPGMGTCAAPAGNFDIYAYTSLDSALGVRCYFEVDDSNGNSGCVQVFTVPASTAGENKLCNLSGTCVYGPDTPLPKAILSALHTQHWFAVGTDILPADAKFALLRMFTPCGQPLYRNAYDLTLRLTYGLGYQGSVSGIGEPVFSHFSNKEFHTLDFNFSGNDPINSGKPVPGYSISTLGAKPILVVVSPAGGTGIGTATDINGFTLALFTEGVLGRNTDLDGPTVTSPVTTLINEPLSGPYNVLEYSIPNSSQFHTTQDESNCSSNGGVYSNAMALQSTNGKIPAYRVRAVGTNEMITQLQAASVTDQRLGFFYWSAANASTFTAANGKYLTVNGVDPLQDAYTDGVLPGVDSSHPLSNVTFKWLNMGDYPIWSVLRILSKSPTPIGVTNLISAAQGLNASQHNFISPANLQVWHSHISIPLIGVTTWANGTTINTANDLCNTSGAMVESGGDAGGTTVSKQVNVDFCSDFANPQGLINKTN